MHLLADAIFSSSHLRGIESLGAGEVCLRSDGNSFLVGDHGLLLEWDRVAIRVEIVDNRLLIFVSDP